MGFWLERSLFGSCAAVRAGRDKSCVLAQNILCRHGGGEVELIARSVFFLLSNDDSDSTLL